MTRPEQYEERLKTTNWKLARHDQCYGLCDRLRMWVLRVHKCHRRPGRLHDLCVVMLDPHASLACLPHMFKYIQAYVTCCSSRPNHRLPFACSRESRMLDEQTRLFRMSRPRATDSPERTS